jgi:hypothetical protein
MHDMRGMTHPMQMGAGHADQTVETMIKIKKEHFWFSIVGFGVALFKFIYDGACWKKPFVRFLWPAFISILGLLLIFYAG